MEGPILIKKTQKVGIRLNFVNVSNPVHSFMLYRKKLLEENNRVQQRITHTYKDRKITFYNHSRLQNVGQNFQRSTISPYVSTCYNCMKNQESRQ